ncbi:NADH-quinone oxidoreductase subunit J [Paenirhodobacter enshiensis]|uniref:NADH-quinone oxidoreductase subunit J n=1 Tax=Paenirhodobacter enshiensis TaxID=1105367 RepID=A0A086XYU3_9RHOB|nr:NADH-quinone oxidoreductase subunit J [Paenirhodobacter enshiensis]KFI27193.1 NADH:ubiquinone oxidoreductase subunit J [Paenirhodobacter enshiensis]
MTVFAFYLFALVAVVAGLMVVMSRNPVHSVLWLILTFLSASGLFVLIGAEFVAMLLIIVYVGAVAVLFLFVVMMLDIDFNALRGRFVEYAPVGGLFAVILLVLLGVGIAAWHEAPGAAALHGSPIPEGVQNTAAIGLVLYDKYIYLFQSAALVLLVSMIGAILLTLRHRTDVKRQNVMRQMHRDPAKTLELVDVKPGQGL